ncbi:MAG: YggS family pyridoxal phosphate-dependent enzyme [Opitutus sp.]
MNLTFEEFCVRAGAIKVQISAACARAGREPGEVELLAVTKTHPVLAAEYAARYGLAGVGENRVQDGVEKRAQAASLPLRWELIGHLQSNKTRLAARHFDRIQTVDSEKLINQLARAATELGRTLPILLQINAGNDPAKFGADPADAPRLLELALAQPALRVDGLMTIAPLGTNDAATAAHAVRTFSNLHELRDTLAAHCGVPLRELSMGMTGDLDAAIAAGSTLVRVGTALFGPRAGPPR